MPEQWLSKFTKEAKTLKWKFHVVYIFPCERRSVKTNGKVECVEEKSNLIKLNPRI